MSKWQDEYGYPTRKALKAVQKADYMTICEVLEAVWNKTYGSASHNLSAAEREVVGEGDCLRLATGGWSGNEELYGEYNRNMLARMLTWRLSSAGGLHILRVRGGVNEG